MPLEAFNRPLSSSVSTGKLRTMSKTPTPDHGLVDNELRHEDVETYSTLKQSFAASIANGSAQRELEGRGHGGAVRPKKPRRTTPPVALAIPKLPSPSAISLEALHYLPTPVLVLSSLKTVILANDAMGRLLGFEGYRVGNPELVDREEKAPDVEEVLHGQTLSQIGVEMLQNGQPIWVNWEVSYCPFQDRAFEALS